MEVGLFGALSTLFTTQADFAGEPHRRSFHDFPTWAFSEIRSKEGRTQNTSVRELMKILKLPSPLRENSLRMFLLSLSRDMSYNCNVYPRAEMLTSDFHYSYLQDRHVPYYRNFRAASTQWLARRQDYCKSSVAIVADRVFIWRSNINSRAISPSATVSRWL